MTGGLHIAALCGACLPVGALAQATGLEDFLGIWCPHGDGITMNVQPDRIVFDRNRVCDFKTVPVVSDGGFAAVLTCRYEYVTGETEDGGVTVIIENQQRGVAIRAEETDRDNYGGRYLSVRLNGEGIGPEFGPCG